MNEMLIIPNILIIHYNTPYLTSYLVKSIKKYTPSARIYIFDNSDKQPFVSEYEDITIFDNTKGDYIDFDEFLSKYPNRTNSPGKYNDYGSAKHCISVDKCMELIKEDFILLDSDVLLKRDISDIFDEKYMYVGQVITQGNSTVKRILPFICYINVKKCIDNNIHYFDDNMMHGLQHTIKNKYSDRYDTGSSFFYNTTKFIHKEIKVDDYIVHYGGASWLEKREKRTPHKHTPEEWISINYKYWNHQNKNVIYTCITGNYDSLLDPIEISNGFDYVCFTDNPYIKSTIWEIKPIPSELDNLSQIKKQRCIKINPHIYLPEYELSIWVDANVQLKKDVNEYINDNCTDGCVFIGEHPTRKCIYNEMKIVVSMKKDTEENIKGQRERYKEEGFPKNYGLVQSCIVIRKHNEESCKKLMDCWWNELKNGSHRDQLSFDYSRWKTNMKDFKFLDKSIFNCKFFKWNSIHKPIKNSQLPEIKKADDSFINQDKQIAHEHATINQNTKINKIVLQAKQTHNIPYNKHKKQTAVFIGKRRG